MVVSCYSKPTFIAQKNASGTTQRILVIQKLFKELFLFAKGI